MSFARKILGLGEDEDAQRGGGPDSAGEKDHMARRDVLGSRGGDEQMGGGAEPQSEGDDMFGFVLQEETQQRRGGRG